MYVLHNASAERLELRCRQSGRTQSAFFDALVYVGPCNEGRVPTAAHSACAVLRADVLLQAVL